MHTSLRRGAGALCAAVLTVTTLGLSAGSANADTASDTADAAGQVAAYLAAHDDVVGYDGFDATDYGLTLDTVLALDAAGVGATQSAATLSVIRDEMGNYIGAGDTKYAGGTAKTLLAVLANKPEEQIGRLGGVNLINRLKQLETSSGRFSDKATYEGQPADYSNTFSQSLAIIAIRKAGQTPSAKAGAFLRAQQCPNGSFRITLKTTQCKGSSADVDATAMAAQALLSLPSSSARTTALNKAADFLKSKQLADGGLPAADATTSNANSTGLATVVMRALGKNGFVTKAQAYLSSLVFDCSYPAALQGLIAFNTARHDAAGQDADAAPTAQDVRATAQGILGLTGKRYQGISIDGSSDDAPVADCAA